MHSEVVTRKVAYTLYLCHLLSTWNARTYEFAAVLFTASAFPGNLVASSVLCCSPMFPDGSQGIAMSLSVLFFASMLGTLVDRASSRLTTLITTIMANRISIISACVCWLFIVTDNTKLGHSTPTKEGAKDEPEVPPDDLLYSIKITFFVIIIMLSIIEHLSRTMNVLSIERDWLPTLAPPHINMESEHGLGLAELNAGIGRIDLVCKLLSPLLFSTFISAVGSTRIGILGVLALSAGTWTLEIWSARLVWKMNGRVREPKHRAAENMDAAETDSLLRSEHRQAQDDRAWLSLPWIFRRNSYVFCSAFSAIRIWVLNYYQNLTIFFSYAVWVPSMALSIVHFSVLNYSTTLTVYLLNAGFSLNFIAVAKIISAVAEISSTFFVPWGVYRIGAMWAAGHPSRPHYGSSVNTPILADREEDQNDEAQQRSIAQDKDDAVFMPEADMGVAVLGLVGLAQMEVCLLPAFGVLWYLSSSADSPSLQTVKTSALIAASLLVIIPLSRFGRWTNHLATRQLTQTLVPAAHRSSFAGAEAGFVALFQLGHWVATAVWNQRAQFRWHSLNSVLSIAVSTTAYGLWLRWIVRKESGRTSNDYNS